MVNGVGLIRVGHGGEVIGQVPLVDPLYGLTRLRSLPLLPDLFFVILSPLYHVILF